MKRKILVSALSGDIGCGIAKILEAQPGVELFGCDCNEIAVGMDHVQHFVTCPLAISSGYIEFILSYCEENQIDYFIPVNEHEIETVARSRQMFYDKGIKLLIQSDDILSICLNKSKTMELLAAHGVCVPKTYTNIQYVCKPNKSNGSKGIVIGDVRRDLGASEDYLIQEYIAGDEYTVGVFQAPQQPLRVIAFKRQLKNGYSNLVELVHDQPLEQLAARVAKLLQLQGYINIQLRKRGNAYYIFEINPRISGTVRFRDMLGFHDVLWWLDMLDGRQPAAYEPRYSKALGIRELNEKFLIKE